MIKSIHLSEGLRMFFTSTRMKIFGYRKIEGDSEKICRQIIENCWDSERQYFRVSPNNFCEFYARDFAWCIEPLMRLGYEIKVRQTVEYAMRQYAKYDKITTTISPKGVPFDFPCYASDSLPSMIYLLNVAVSVELIEKHQDFLSLKIKEYYESVFDKKKGIIKEHLHLSSIKDHAVRNSSCYDNIMAAFLNKNLRDIKILYNTFKNHNFQKTILEKFWNNEGTGYFNESIDGKTISGDANTFPYWTKVFESIEMINSSVESMLKEGLLEPFPLKYSKTKEEKEKLKVMQFFAGNYEGNTSWSHLAMIYLSVLKQSNHVRFKLELDNYRKLIEKNKNFIEVYENGKPFMSLFYAADSEMLWAAIYLDLFLD